MTRAFWTLSRLADALAGVNPSTPAPPRRAGHGDAFPRGHSPVARIWTDTRTIGAADCFVALRGDSFDGHDFLEQAVDAGAAALVVDDARRARALGVPAFVVPNTLTALGALARYRREAWGRPVVAVGGSNGKTSTKELLRAALAARLTVHATQGNLNNQVGVPLTLLALPDAADVAVVEVGTNTPGEIAILRDIVRPDAAVVTAIEEEHLEGFGDLAGVLREEASLLDGVPLAVVPSHETALVAEARRRARRVVATGLPERAVPTAHATGGDAGAVGVGALVESLIADSASLAADGTGRLSLGAVEVTVPLRGEHNLRNAMLALAVARASGVSVADAGRGISTLQPGAVPGMRSAVEPLGAALLVNDCYNANPGSARAAIRLLGAVAGARPRVIVLGTMRELGAHEGAAHRDIAREALASGAALVAGIGAFAPALRELAPDDARVVTADDVADLWPALAPRLARHAAILLKASRGVRLERLVPHLRDWAGVAPPAHRTG
ncbi:MAG: UDP-N-acetylmuramoyl-tripeptide--D-alanyl-D-alanine ligase [Gemmatimonadota bacterium]|nr:UDP-N-acetylmuramoyl-tripeptide--D-alanyl-D-alanine ligase [Gemmatimonadota bacterium]